jgi:hypothetical protein
LGIGRSRTIPSQRNHRARGEMKMGGVKQRARVIAFEQKELFLLAPRLQKLQNPSVRCAASSKSRPQRNISTP